MNRLRSGLLVLLLFAGACGGGGGTSVETFDAGGGPSAVAVLGQQVWVTDDENGTVRTFDAEGQPVGEPIAVKENPIALTTSRRDVWVAHASGWVVRIDSASRSVTFETQYEGSFTGIAVANELVWVSDVEKGLISIDPERDGAATEMKLEHGGVRVLEVDDVLWVSGRENTVSRVEGAGPSADVQTFTVGRGPIGLARQQDRVWVTNSDDGTAQVAGEDRAVATGNGPIGAAVAGAMVWVANQDDQTVVPIDPVAMEAGEPIEVGTAARGIATDGSVLWVVGANPGRLVRVQPNAG